MKKRVFLYILGGCAASLYSGISLLITLVATRTEFYFHKDSRVKNFKGEKVILITRDGLRISGILLKGNLNKCILIVHGLTAHKFDPDIFELGKALNQKGYTVLLIDLRGHGESEGKIISGGYFERFDVIAGVEFLKNKFPGSKIIVIGISMGGAATLLASNEIKIDGLVLDSTFSDLENILNKEITKMTGISFKIFKPMSKLWAKILFKIDVKKVKPVEFLKKLSIPVCIIHSRDDQRIPVEEAKRLFENAPPGSKLIIFKNVPHAKNLTLKKEYLEEIEDYLKNI